MAPKPLEWSGIVIKLVCWLVNILQCLIVESTSVSRDTLIPVLHVTAFLPRGQAQDTNRDEPTHADGRVFCTEQRKRPAVVQPIAVEHCNWKRDRFEEAVQKSRPPAVADGDQSIQHGQIHSCIVTPTTTNRLSAARGAYCCFLALLAAITGKSVAWIPARLKELQRAFRSCCSDQL